MSIADLLKTAQGLKTAPVKASARTSGLSNLLQTATRATVATPVSPINISSSTPNYGGMNTTTPAIKTSGISDSSTLGIIKNTITGLANPENLPLGIGSIIKTANQDPETVANMNLSDVAKGAFSTLKDYVLKYPFLAVSNLAGVPVKFNIPGLGEVTNRQFNTANRIKNGENAAQVLVEEGTGAIFDTLFLVGLGQKVFGGRPVTIAKGELPPEVGITAKPVKSFRLYEEPLYTQKITPDFISKMATEKGVKIENYNPELPTYFKMTGKTSGKIVGEVVQVKPSYFETFTSKFKGDISKVPETQLTVIATKETSIKALDNVKPEIIPTQNVPVVPPPTNVETLVKEAGIEQPRNTPEQMLKKVRERQPSTSIQDVTPPGYGPGETSKTPEVIKSSNGQYFSTEGEKVYLNYKDGSKILYSSTGGEIEAQIAAKKLFQNVEGIPSYTRQFTGNNSSGFNSESNAEIELKKLQKKFSEYDLSIGKALLGTDKSPSSWRFVVNGVLKKEVLGKYGIKTQGSPQAFGKALAEQKSADWQKKYGQNDAEVKKVTGEIVKSMIKSEPLGKFTLEPSQAKTPKEIQKESEQVFGKESIGSKKTGLKPFADQATYLRQPVSKTEMKTLMDKHPEFKLNSVLTVGERPRYSAYGNHIGGTEKVLTFKGKNSSFTIKADALGLNSDKLKVGTRLVVKAKSLTAKGSPQQMRAYEDGKAFGFNPKNLENLDSPAATKEVGKIIKRSEIAKTLSDMLDVPIRNGKFRHAGAIGIFKPGPKVVRYKAGGLPTKFHEIGHYLDGEFNFSSFINITERKALMAEYGYKYEGQAKKQQKEAFAEFLRFRMTGQKEKADKWAPRFSKIWDEKIGALPEVKDVLDTAAADYQRWKEQPAVAKVLSQISIGKEAKGNLLDRASSNLHHLYTVAVDDLHPLKEFVSLNGKTPAQNDPYILARNLRGWIGKADTFLNKGTFGKNYWEVRDGKIKAVFKGKSFTEIMKPVEKAGNLDDFRVYVVAQRVVELSHRHINTGISFKDAQEALAELKDKHPEFEQVSQDLYKYQDDLLVYAHENGLIGKEGLAKIKVLNKFRVPFYRVMEETRGAYMGGKKVTGNMASPIKKIKGSDRDIIDPIESIIKDTYAIINAAERNNIGVAMANLAQKNFELGRLFEQVAQPMKPVNVNLNEVLQKALVNTGLSTEDIPEDLQDIMVTLFRPAQDHGPNMLNVNFGDKQRLFQVEPELFKAIQGLNTEDLGMMVKLLSYPAKWLRAGATLTPDFMLRNPVRDQFSAFVYSKYGFKPGIDLIRGVFELFKKGDVYDLWKMGGGEHAMMVSLDRTALQKGFDDLVRSKGGKAFEYVKHPLQFLQLISQLGEQGTRLGEMKRALDSMANPVEGAFASREVTLDFARIGGKTKSANALIAFFNPTLQGTDKMGRSWKDNPGRTLWKTLLGITLPSILLYLANRKDKRWKEIPSWQKDLFWIVMTPNHIYRIPKPFELGIIFGSVPERILEYMDTQDLNLFNELEKSITDGISPSWMPTAGLPIWENISNYSLFLDRPIVSAGKENLPPEGQYGTYTSEVAKLIGKVFNYSPSMVDNLIQGYTGGLGKYATTIVDKALSGTGISKVAPKASGALEDTPVLKAFMIRPPVGQSAESVNKVYNLYADANAASMFVNNLIKEGDTAKAKEFMAEHPEIVYVKLLRKVIDDFSLINKTRDQIQNSKTITPDDKRIKIKSLDETQVKTAKQILDMISPKKPENKWNILDKLNIFGAKTAEASVVPDFWIRDNRITSNDLTEAIPVLFGEISDRSSDKQMLEAQTILNTAFNRMEQYKEKWGRDVSLTEVLQMDNQYQAYGGKQYQRVKNGEATTPGDKRRLDSINKVLEKVYDGTFQNNIGDYVFYAHKPDGRIFARAGKLFKS